MPTTTQRPYLEPSAASPAADDVVLIDGATNGTRALPMSYFAANFAPIPNLDREIRLDGPVAYWPMTEASGNFQDAIYGGRDFTPSASPSYAVTPLGTGVSASPYFSSSVYASTADNPLGMPIFRSGTYTVEFVFAMTSALVEDVALFTLGRIATTTTPANGNSLFRVAVRAADKTLAVAWGSTISTLSAVSQPLSLGQVYHVAIRVNALSGSAYVNGIRPVATSFSYSAPGGPPVGDGSRLWLHAASDGDGDAAFMYMGYLAVYNTALSPARIMAHAVNLGRA